MSAWCNAQQEGCIRRASRADEPQRCRLLRSTTREVCQLSWPAERWLQRQSAGGAVYDEVSTLVG